jgi:steroid delta-isomerase
MIDFGRALGEYARLFERLEPADLERFGSVYSETVRFKDPFQDVQGVAAVRDVFEHMFRTTREPRFRVHHRAVNGPCGFLLWTFHFRLPDEVENRCVEGVSLVCFDAEGRVAEHLDYWDPAEQLYRRVPILGWLLGRIRARLAAPAARARSRETTDAARRGVRGLRTAGSSPAPPRARGSAAPPPAGVEPSPLRR